MVKSYFYNDDIMDYTEKSKISAKRRKDDYKKAKRFRQILLETSHSNTFKEYIRSRSLSRYIKNTSYNVPTNEKGFNKTRNKGIRRNKTYAPSYNYKASDLRKIEKMNYDQVEYEKALPGLFNILWIDTI